MQRLGEECRAEGARVFRWKRGWRLGVVRLIDLSRCRKRSLEWAGGTGAGH